MRFQQHHNQQKEYHQQREDMFKKHEEEKKSKKKKNKLIIYSVIIIIILASVVYAALYFFTPGPYDNFAQCLTEKGAVMYGAIKWCTYTQGQANMFGKSFKYIDYRDESELPGLKVRPTWVIDGKWYQRVQSFQTLAAATGCEI